MKLRLIDCRLSRLPEVVGLCQDNVPGIAEYVNAAQQRLLYAKEAGDESWFGTWAEVRLNVSRNAPYITLPREIARLEAATVCDRPVPVQNQFYEYLQYGNGRMRKDWLRRCNTPQRAVYTRNNEPLFTDLFNAPQVIGIYTTDIADVGVKRVLIQGLDQNGVPVYTQDNGQQVLGEFVTLETPFATTKNQYSKVTGVQKDVTLGIIQFVQIDPNTAAQYALLTMEPGEKVASYRRYFFDKLPCGCCPANGVTTPVPCPPAQVTAIAKMELIPVVADTDWLLFQNLEAIIEAAAEVFFSKVQNMDSQKLAAVHHTNAIRFLNGELGHYLGVNQPAAHIAYFGSARLERQAIGTLI
jgi:hypothetical protein